MLGNFLPLHTSTERNMDEKTTDSLVDIISNCRRAFQTSKERHLFRSSNRMKNTRLMFPLLMKRLVLHFNVPANRCWKRSSNSGSKNSEVWTFFEPIGWNKGQTCTSARETTKPRRFSNRRYYLIALNDGRQILQMTIRCRSCRHIGHNFVHIKLTFHINGQVTPALFSTIDRLFFRPLYLSP